MKIFLDDLRFGYRLLRARPAFTVIAVLTLALGISVTTAVFSVLDTLYWKAFPGAADPRRLVELETVAPDGSLVRGSWLDSQFYRQHLKSVASVAAHKETTLLLGLPEQARPVEGVLVSNNYFEVLGVKAALGRVISPQEHSGAAPGTHPVAVISHRLWSSEFAASPAVLGKTLLVNRQPLTIIGVTPATFRGAIAGMPSDVWVPFTMGLALQALETSTFEATTMRNVYQFARLAPGVSLEAAGARLAMAASSLAASAPVGYQGFGAIFEPMWRARLHSRTAFLQPMLILMGVSLLVLLIACANVANLLLARSVGGMREFGMRIALGASRWRLVRHIFTETLLLAGASAFVGVPLALWLTDSYVLLLPEMARAGAPEIGIDQRVLAFAGLLCVATALVSSLAPALLVLRTSVDATVREGGRSGTPSARSHRLRGALVISEVALALVVLIGAGLFFRSYRNESALDPGFERENVLLARIPIAGGGYGVEELRQFCTRLRDRLQTVSGVSAVSYADYAPLWATDGAYASTLPEGFVAANPEQYKVYRTSISPGYFALLKVPLLEGRDFSARDTGDTQRTMIVNQAFARRFYNGGSPVGRRVMVWKRWYTIVGMVRDSRYYSFTEAPRPHFYLPFDQSYQQGQHIVFFVRTVGDPKAFVATLRNQAASIDPNAAGLIAAPLADFNALLLLPLKLATSLLAALGILALLLAAIGLYGVMSYSVSQQTKEISIRMALGAMPGEVLRAVFRQSMVMTFAGLALGLLLALSSTRLVAGLLVGVQPFDPLTFAAASLFLTVIAALASLLPARRATRVDPFAAMRSE